ncbi:phage antirepressor KilAC domain-containing protein [Bacteroides sp.]
MNNSIIYSYQGSEISFINKGESTMINATQMAKPFGKQVYEYLRLPSTKELINAITGKSRIAENHLVTTVRGGLNPGTWLHENIALDFAQWLSVDFRLWCNDCIKELLRMGVVTLEQQNISLLNEIKAQASKVKYVDDVLQSVNTYTSTQMAKELGMREAEQLHKLLKEKGVMFRQSGQWMLRAKYSGKGYTKSRTSIYARSDDSQVTNTITVWTELGRAFLHTVFAEEMQSA